MGIKIKKEEKPSLKMKPFEITHTFSVPLIGIVDVITMMTFYMILPEEGLMGLKMFYIFFALVGAGFAYWAFTWKMIVGKTNIIVHRGFGLKKEILFSDIAKVEVHKKKKIDNLTHFSLIDANGAVMLKVYPRLKNSARLLERLKLLGLKIEEVAA